MRQDRPVPTPAVPAPPVPAAPAPSAPRPGPQPAAGAAVTEALATLESLADRPLAEHVTVFTAVHDALAARLAATES